MNSQTSDKQAVLLGSGAVVLWSTVATVFNLSLDFVSPLTLVTLASVTSWFFLGTILVISGEMRTLNQIKGSEWARLLAMGLINPTLYYFLLFGAYAKLPAQEAMAINYTWGLVLPLLAAPLLGQALKGRDIVYALVSYCGVFVIATRGEVLTFELSDPTGVGLAIGSTLLWALYWIGNTRISTPPVQGLFVGFTSATAILLTISLFTGSLINLPWQALA